MLQIPIDAGQDWHRRRSIRVLQGATRVIPPWRGLYQIWLMAEHEVPPMVRSDFHVFDLISF